jgi:hypothetical protein
VHGTVSVLGVDHLGFDDGNNDIDSSPIAVVVVVVQDMVVGIDTIAVRSSPGPCGRVGVVNKPRLFVALCASCSIAMESWAADAVNGIEAASTCS